MEVLYLIRSSVFQFRVSYWAGSVIVALCYPWRICSCSIYSVAINFVQRVVLKCLKSHLFRSVLKSYVCRFLNIRYNFMTRIKIIKHCVYLFLYLHGANLISVDVVEHLWSRVLLVVLHIIESALGVNFNDCGSSMLRGLRVLIQGTLFAHIFLHKAVEVFVIRQATK